MASCVVQQIRKTWRSLDVGLHSIAFAPNQDLQERLVDSSDDGRRGHLLPFVHPQGAAREPWMHEGGTLLAMRHHRSDTLGRQPTSTGRSILARMTL
jgi:enoyl-[acyl-carrier protein] reductase I